MGKRLHLVSSRSLPEIAPLDSSKIFLTARPEVRAARRAAEMTGDPDSVAGVGRQLEERDQRDTTRKASPLQAAPDALVLDTSDLGIEQVIERILEVVAERRGS